MDLQKIILDSIGSGVSDKIASSTGLDQKTVDGVVKKALPTLLAALSKNTSNSNGAEKLDQALSEKHDGSLLNNIGSLFGSSKSENSDGKKIVGHILGSDCTAVEQEISESTGTDKSDVEKVMSFVAPVVLAHLGKAKTEQSLDADGIAGLLKNQELRDGILGMAKDFIDKNNDGNVVDDLLGMIKKK